MKTAAHRQMVMKFVRDLFPKAKFRRIYNAKKDGWHENDFHRCCDNKGWTITIVQTTKDFIFGGFTTLDWETPGFF